MPADISSYLTAIKTAVYGEQVRGAIHDAIKAINDAMGGEVDAIGPKGAIASSTNLNNITSAGIYGYTQTVAGTLTNLPSSSPAATSSFGILAVFRTREGSSSSGYTLQVMFSFWTTDESHLAANRHALFYRLNNGSAWGDWREISKKLWSSDISTAETSAKNYADTKDTALKTSIQNGAVSTFPKINTAINTLSDTLDALAERVGEIEVSGDVASLARKIDAIEDDKENWLIGRRNLPVNGVTNLNSMTYTTPGTYLVSQSVARTLLYWPGGDSNGTLVILRTLDKDIVAQGYIIQIVITPHSIHFRIYNDVNHGTYVADNWSSWLSFDDREVVTPMGIINSSSESPANLNSYTQAGAYQITQGASASILNWPDANRWGSLLVFRTGSYWKRFSDGTYQVNSGQTIEGNANSGLGIYDSTETTVQIALTNDTTGQHGNLYYRQKFNTGNWTEWEYLSGDIVADINTAKTNAQTALTELGNIDVTNVGTVNDTALMPRAAVTTNSDLNDYTTPGAYRITQTAYGTLSHTPNGLSGAHGVLLVNTTAQIGSGRVFMQSFMNLATKRIYIRTYYPDVETPSWSNWEQLKAESSDIETDIADFKLMMDKLGFDVKTPTQYVGGYYSQTDGSLVQNDSYSYTSPFLMARGDKAYVYAWGGYQQAAVICTCDVNGDNRTPVVNSRMMPYDEQPYIYQTTESTYLTVSFSPSSQVDFLIMVINKDGFLAKVVNVDKTLTLEETAAEAKKVGTEIRRLDQRINNLPVSASDYTVLLQPDSVVNPTYFTLLTSFDGEEGDITTWDAINAIWTQKQNDGGTVRFKRLDTGEILYPFKDNGDLIAVSRYITTSTGYVLIVQSTYRPYYEDSCRIDKVQYRMSGGVV